jgi:hypothetical protein
MTITTKATRVFAMLKEKAGPDYDIEFSANYGWFNVSKIVIHYIQRNGEVQFRK